MTKRSRVMAIAAIIGVTASLQGCDPRETPASRNTKSSLPLERSFPLFPIPKNRPYTQRTRLSPHHIPIDKSADEPIVRTSTRKLPAQDEVAAFELAKWQLDVARTERERAQRWELFEQLSRKKPLVEPMPADLPRHDPTADLAPTSKPTYHYPHGSPTDVAEFGLLLNPVDGIHNLGSPDGAHGYDLHGGHDLHGGIHGNHGRLGGYPYVRHNLYGRRFDESY